MTSDIELLYPTLDIFLYDLCEGLGDSETQKQENRKIFWKHIYKDGLSKEKLEAFAQAEAEESNYIELLGEQHDEEFKPPDDGYYFPVKLGDSYGLQVDCSGRRDWEGKPQAIACFKEIQELTLKQRGEEGQIGESWLIWGKLTSPQPEKNMEAIAKQCLAQLGVKTYENWNVKIKNKGIFKTTKAKNQGKFKDAILFEFSQSYPHKKHILVAFFPDYQDDKDIFENVSKLYRQLIQLFYYRNKVLWIYVNTRKLKSNLKQFSHQIQEIVQDLPDRVKQSSLELHKLQQEFAKTLTILSDYGRSLSYLQEYQYAIEVNAHNYQKRLEKLKELDNNCDLDFLQEFQDNTFEKYLPQVTTDYKSLSAGLQLLENTIKTLEGIIQLEQTKRDRDLNKTIFIVSAGIGTASASASSIANFAEKIIVPPPQPTSTLSLWLSYSFAFGLSIGMGLVFSGLTWVGMKLLWRKS